MLSFNHLLTYFIIGLTEKIFYNGGLPEWSKYLTANGETMILNDI
jgi:hypothetical protein